MIGLVHLIDFFDIVGMNVRLFSSLDDVDDLVDFIDLINWFT